MFPTTLQTTRLCGDPSIYTQDKLQVSTMIVDYWTSFAKTGVPQSSMGPTWTTVQRDPMGQQSHRWTPYMNFVLMPLPNYTRLAYTEYPSNESAELIDSIACQQ